MGFQRYGTGEILPEVPEEGDKPNSFVSTEPEAADESDEAEDD